MRYDGDYDYADGRLRGTIVRHGDDPVYVHCVRGDGAAEISEVGGDHTNAVPLEELNLKPVPLGYVNMGGTCTFMSRVPMREDWRQGLRKNNCRSMEGMWNLDQIKPKDLSRTIKGEYPSLKECVDMMNHGGEVQAWCRDFAVDSSNRVFYKGLYQVGNFKQGFGVFLINRYKYLTEKLEESLV